MNKNVDMKQLSPIIEDLMDFESDELDEIRKVIFKEKLLMPYRKRHTPKEGINDEFTRREVERKAKEDFEKRATQVISLYDEVGEDKLKRIFKLLGEHTDIKEYEQSLPDDAKKTLKEAREMIKGNRNIEKFLDEINNIDEKQNEIETLEIKFTLKK